MLIGSGVLVTRFRELRGFGVGNRRGVLADHRALGSKERLRPAAVPSAGFEPAPPPPEGPRLCPAGPPSAVTCSYVETVVRVVRRCSASNDVLIAILIARSQASKVRCGRRTTRDALGGRRLLTKTNLRRIGRFFGTCSWSLTYRERFPVTRRSSTPLRSGIFGRSEASCNSSTGSPTRKTLGLEALAVEDGGCMPA